MKCCSCLISNWYFSLRAWPPSFQKSMSYCRDLGSCRRKRPIWAQVGWDNLYMFITATPSVRPVHPQRCSMERLSPGGRKPHRKTVPRKCNKRAFGLPGCKDFLEVFGATRRTPGPRKLQVPGNRPGNNKNNKNQPRDPPERLAKHKVGPSRTVLHATANSDPVCVAIGWRDAPGIEPKTPVGRRQTCFTTACSQTRAF